MIAKKSSQTQSLETLVEMVLIDFNSLTRNKKTSFELDCRTNLGRIAS